MSNLQSAANFTLDMDTLTKFSDPTLALMNFCYSWSEISKTVFKISVSGQELLSPEIHFLANRAHFLVSDLTFELVDGFSKFKGLICLESIFKNHACVLDAFWRFLGLESENSQIIISLLNPLATCDYAT